MRIKKTHHAVLISDLPVLDARTAADLVAQTRSALHPQVAAIELDLSRTESVDSKGLGALVALYRWIQRHRDAGIAFRLLNPAPPARQLIELTRLHRLFEVVERQPVGAPALVA
ncbi:MAG: STAS domain-containing protein [Opitutae bacterium]|nr:STAS domain-containing protein [Opitutae bacterium]